MHSRRFPGFNWHLTFDSGRVAFRLRPYNLKVPNLSHTIVFIFSASNLTTNDSRGPRGTKDNRNSCHATRYLEKENYRPAGDIALHWRDRRIVNGNIHYKST